MIRRFYQVLMFWLFFFSLAACQPKETNDTAAKATVRQDSAAKETAEAQLPFPVYKDFSELEHIFKYQNDTTYVINFWATWCIPCVEELPYFEKLHTELGGEKVKVILVSLDFAKDVNTKLVNFVKKHRLQSQIIALTDGKYNNWVDKVSPDWSGAIPVTYIYRKDTALFHDQQYASYEELEASVKKIGGAG